MNQQDRKWSKKQALRYADRILRTFPIKWEIAFYFDEDKPVWVDTSPPGPAWAVLGQYQVENGAARQAQIWVSLSESAHNGETAEVIWHEMLHVLFHSAGIDACDTENEAQSNYIHQIIQSLAPVFAEGF